MRENRQSSYSRITLFLSVLAALACSRFFIPSFQSHSFELSFGLTESACAEESAPGSDQQAKADDPFADQDWASKIVSVPLQGPILPDFMGGQENALVKAFEKAGKEKPKLVILEIDSPGGAVNSCDLITHAILKADVPTVALILHKAISGGALVATSCKEIVMVKGSRIGDVQPMNMMSSEGMDERTAEKIEADVRAMFSANADANGYPKPVLHAMVSRSIALYRVTFSDGTHEYYKEPEVKVLEENITEGREKRKIKNKELVVEAGKLLHVSAEDAVGLDLAKEVVDSREAFYKSREIDLLEVVQAKIAPGEFQLNLPRTKLLLLGIFLIVGIAGTLTEMHAPGFGIPGACGIIGFAGFFAILVMHGTAEPWEIGLFILGIILLVIEIVVLPGFGVAGVSGILCILSGLGLAFLPEWDSFSMTHYKWEFMARFSLLLLSSGILACVGVGALLMYGRKLAFLRVFYLGEELPDGREALVEARSHQEDEHEHLQNQNEKYLGKSGVAETTLRPSGKVRLDDGTQLDVVTDGRLLQSGTKVVVKDIGMNRILVVPVEN